MSKRRLVRVRETLSALEPEELRFVAGGTVISTGGGVICDAWPAHILSLREADCPTCVC